MQPERAHCLRKCASWRARLAPPARLDMPGRYAREKRRAAGVLRRFARLYEQNYFKYFLRFLDVFLRSFTVAFFLEPTNFFSDLLNVVLEILRN